MISYPGNDLVMGVDYSLWISIDDCNFSYDFTTSRNATINILNYGIDINEFLRLQKLLMSEYKEVDISIEKFSIDKLICE